MPTLNFQSKLPLLKETWRTPLVFEKSRRATFIDGHFTESAFHSCKVCWVFPFCCLKSFRTPYTDVVSLYHQKPLLWLLLAPLTRRRASGPGTRGRETLQKPPTPMPSADHQIWALHPFTKTPEAPPHETFPLPTAVAVLGDSAQAKLFSLPSTAVEWNLDLFSPQLRPRWNNISVF